MNWLTLFTGSKTSNTMINISGKNIEIVISPNAARALAKRDTPLIVELELAFACFARKQVRFHETSANKNVVEVTRHLALLICTIVPDTCDAATDGTSRSVTALRNFMPKWVRLDFVKSQWRGDYGL